MSEGAQEYGRNSSGQKCDPTFAPGLDGTARNSKNHDALQLVTEYLNHLEARDLDAARQVLGPGFVMQFPGSQPMSLLSELVQWASTRYRSVTKTHEGVDCVDQSGTTIIYLWGTLAGVWCDGTSFTDIRFVDRFEVVDQRIIRQDVWNDLGEALAQLSAAPTASQGGAHA